MSVIPCHPLLTNEAIFDWYTAKQYIEYCAAIRKAIHQNPDSPEPPDAKFFRTKFVDEMEPLAKVCQHLFGADNNESQVRCMDKPLTDGEIIARSGGESVYVEFTSAKNHRLLDYAYSELKTKGRLISLTFFTDEDVPHLKTFTEDAVEAEDLGMAAKKHINSISARIAAKLEKQWPTDRTNWLCIVLDDITFWPEGIETIFDEIYRKYRPDLLERSITELWFVGDQSLKRHSV